MELDHAIQALASGCDKPKLRRVGRILGDRLPERRLEELRDARAELSRARELAAGSELAEGYLLALADVVRSFEATVARAHEAAADVDRAARAGWREVLAAIDGGAHLPSEIAAATGKKRAQIARVLREMTAAELVEQAPPRSDRRQRPRVLTLRGEAALASLEADEGGRRLAEGSVDDATPPVDLHEQAWARQLHDALEQAQSILVAHTGALPSDE